MTTTVRSVRVELEAAVAGYIRDITLAGDETDRAFSGIEAKVGKTDAAIGGLEKSTAGLSKTSASARVEQSSLGREIEKSGTSASKAERSIDKYSGRIGLLLKAAVGLGPALIPIGAIGVPALAGLAAQGGFAAGALGASVLALQGVGDALKALEKARLDPTVENLQAAQAVLHRMGPDAAALALHLEDLTGVRDKLQASAASGFIPGLDDALTQLETGVPVARRLVHEFADISGDILARGAKGITSDRYTEFFQYLQTNARPILDDTADSLGHIAHAFASIFTATAGDQRAFTSFLRESTEDFDQWATRLDGNQDFQNFLAYARENGPAVADALGSIVEAFAAIVEAAAPLGGPTLQIITALADVIDSIASSSIGTEVFTAISAYSLLSTVLPGVKKGYEGIGAAQGKVEARLTSGRATLTTFAGDLRNVARYGSLATESSARLKGQIGPLLKGGAGLAGLAIATSGVADGLGLTNTTSLALIGTLAGPWGAAVGGAVGLIKDFTANSGDAGAATKRWNSVLKDGQTSLDTYKTILQGARDELDNMDDIVPTSFGDALLHGLNPQSIKLSFRALFGDLDDSDLGKQAAEVANLNEQYDDLITTATILGQATGQIDFGDSASMEDLTAVLVRAAPAMDALGISTEDLMAATRDGSILELITRIDQYQYTADSAAGKTKAVEDAIDGLDDGLTTTAESAQALSDSLDALLGPQLGLSAATDQWTTALRHLSDDLDKNNHTLQGNSDAAIKNRAAIRDRVGGLTDVLVAEAKAGATSEELSAHLRGQRQALINAGKAAGISKQDMREYLDVLGLTPDLVKTLIKADTGQATAAVTALEARMNALHDRTVHVNVVTSNVRPQGGQAPTEEQVDPKVHKAAGGYIDGPGTSTSDSIPARLSKGEYVVKASAVNQYGVGFMDALNRQRFADGGLVGSTYTRRTRSQDYTSESAAEAANAFHVAADAASGAAGALKKLEARLDKVQRSYDKEKSKLDALTSSRDSLASSISSSAQHDPFGNGLAGLDAQLDADIGDIGAMGKALAQLVTNGLDPKSALYQALAASMDVNTAQQLAQLSAGDLATRAQRFQQRSVEADALGSTVANQEYLEAIRDQTRTTKRLDHRLEQLADAIKDLKRLPDHVKQGAKDGSREGSEAGAYTGTKAGQGDRGHRVTAGYRTGVGS